MKNRENVMCWLWPAIGLISLASALLGSGHAGAESLPLPQGEEVAPPWRAMLSLGDSEAKPQQAARFRIVDDPKNGRALVVGPWLAGNWFARAQYEKDYPPRRVEVCGLCEVVPRLQELTIPEGTSRCGPRFGLRGFYSLYRYFGIEPSMKLGHTPHDDHGNFSGPDNKDPSGHTSHFLVPYGTYGESHPVVVIQNDW